MVRNSAVFPSPVIALGSQHTVNEAIVAEGGTVVQLSGWTAIYGLEQLCAQQQRWRTRLSLRTVPSSTGGRGSPHANLHAVLQAVYKHMVVTMQCTFLHTAVSCEAAFSPHVHR